MQAAYAGPDCDLAPDPQAMAKFIDWWFGACTRGEIEIGWIDPAIGGVRHFQRFALGSTEIVPFAVQVNLVPGTSVYVRAATIRPRVDGFTTDADFVHAPGAWGDIDTGEQMAQARQVKTMVRPNGSIITGLIPHQRCQTFFRLSEPISHADLARSLNRRIYKLFGGDSAVINPTRLMRLPGTIAWPYKAGRVPELTQFVQSSDRPWSYPLSLLTSQLPAEEETEARGSSAGATPPPGMKAELDSAAEFIRLIRSGVQWHNNMIRLVASWVIRGWSNAEILLAAEAFTLPPYTAEQTFKEVFTAIRGARDKWGVADQDHAVGATPKDVFPPTVIDPWDTLQAPDFPIDVLPDVLRGYVESRARVMGADPCAVAWSGLAASSAALDGRTRLHLKKYDGWAVPAALWVALIGRSSTKKTPVIYDAWRPLEMLQNVALRAYAQQQARWNALPKEEKKDTPPPQRPIRLLTHDATMEGLQDVLSRQDRGIGVLRDELAGFIGAMDKYSGNGKGGAADRAFWLQSYNGGSHVIDRVGRGTVAVNNLLTAICGGIQPERLAQFTDLADDGLWQRFVPIIMKPGALGVDEPPGDAVAAYAARLQGLVDIAPASGAALSDAAHEVRAQLERDIFILEQDEPLGSRFAAFTGKLPGLFGRLALVLSYLEGAGLGYIVGERPARMAQTLIMQCVIPHAARVYMTMSAADGTGVEDMRAVAGYILAKRVDRLLSSDLGRKVRGSFRNMSMQSVQRLLSPLIAGGWLVPEEDGPDNRAWRVSPLVHTTFSARAVTESQRREKAREMVNGGLDDN